MTELSAQEMEELALDSLDMAKAMCVQMDMLPKSIGRECTVHPLTTLPETCWARATGFALEFQALWRSACILFGCCGSRKDVELVPAARDLFVEIGVFYLPEVLLLFSEEDLLPDGG